MMTKVAILGNLPEGAIVRMADGTIASVVKQGPVVELSGAIMQDDHMDEIPQHFYLTDMHTVYIPEDHDEVA